jgi:hypothetical protein
MTEKNKALKDACSKARSCVENIEKALSIAKAIYREIGTEVWDTYDGSPLPLQRELDAVEKIPVDDHDRDVTG